MPRDRAGSFDPKLIAKYQRRFPELVHKIISMYARGHSVHEIRGHLEEFYGIEVWGQRYPAIAQSWRRYWQHDVPFFAFPESVRRIGQLRCGCGARQCN